MIKLEKRLMPYCENCDDFYPCCMRSREKTEDGKSFNINVVVMCQHADVCINAVHQYQKACERNEQEDCKPKAVQCPSCHGTGMTTPENLCGYCDGKGDFR